MSGNGWGVLWVAVWVVLKEAVAGTVTVEDGASLRQALANATPGQHIVLKPGTYEGGIRVSGPHGTAEAPIVIGGAEGTNRPVVRGGNVGIHLINPRHVELRNLVVTGAKYNGISIDDGGSLEASAHHIVLRNLHVSDLDPGGNHDGIKLSGVRDFEIRECVVERWGSRGGSAVDMVGCWRGTIEQCVFRHNPETASAPNNGVQAKGGSHEVVIRRCRFEHAGSRAINIGGSTGPQYFRPALDRWPAERWEARHITAEGNTIIGSAAAVAFVGVDGATVRFNTLYLPQRWAVRILQETTAEGFVPCRNGEFSDNIVVFRSDRWSEAGCNIGPNTAPNTFRFARNVWFCLDAPDRSHPRLPAAETDGIYGVDPGFLAAEEGDFRLRPGSPARKAGATALSHPVR